MKSGWDNLITGIIGMALIGAFLIGLAISIGSIPFGVIVVGVLALALYEFYESAVLPLKGSRDD
ncbi:MAG: hypothetical protein AAF563_09835 [Pseudomonadota bacterium]